MEPVLIIVLYPACLILRFFSPTSLKVLWKPFRVVLYDGVSVSQLSCLLTSLVLITHSHRFRTFAVINDAVLNVSVRKFA